MQGALLKVKGQWIIEHWDDLRATTLPVYPEDAKYCLDSDHGTTVHYKLVDEFGHHEMYKEIGWGDGVTYAKLIHSWEDGDWDTKPGFVEKRSTLMINEISKLVEKYPSNEDLGKVVRRLFNETEQTAVEWLESKLDDILELYPSEWDKVNKVIEQAKQMEKQLKELSDDEIDSEAVRYDKDAITDTPWIHFTNGAKWYRKQTK